MAALILLLIVIVALVWAVACYNGLVGLRNQVANGWRQIDVQLKRRHDLIPNLVNAVRGSDGLRAGHADRRHGRTRQGDGGGRPG